MGFVHQVDIPLEAGLLRKVTDWIGWTSSLPTVRLDVTDMSRALLFKVILAGEDCQFTAVVHDGVGNKLGEVTKAKGWRRIHFDLRAGGSTVGTVDANDSSGFEYRIDEGGAHVGRITMLGQEAVGGIPTTSDDFLLELDVPLAEPLRTLVVASAVSMDVSVSQSAHS